MENRVLESDNGIIENGKLRINMLKNYWQNLILKSQFFFVSLHREKTEN
jgi:hypothetical protein